MIPNQSTKRRVTQTHIDAIAAESGPCYGVRLIKTLPLTGGSMLQAMPSRQDLQQVMEINQRVVAGYEVLLGHWREQQQQLQSWKDGHAVQEQRHGEEVDRLKNLIRGVINGEWCVTDLQEAIGDV